jgi:mannose-6-phosphate isomerase-like protein (cupin superfamily)
MKTSISLVALCFLVAVTPGAAAAQAGTAGGRGANTPPAAPAPGSAGIFRANSELQAALARSIASGGALASASITVTDQYRASLVRRAEPNGAIAHPGNTEMHYIVEGSGTVVTGGTVIRREGALATIEGGESHRVVTGDIIIIPAGSAHRYSEIVEPITYLEFRFVAPE